jgi:hypothetical protein
MLHIMFFEKCAGGVSVGEGFDSVVSFGRRRPSSRGGALSTPHHFAPFALDSIFPCFLLLLVLVVGWVGGVWVELTVF